MLYAILSARRWIGHVCMDMSYVSREMGRRRSSLGILHTHTYSSTHTTDAVHVLGVSRARRGPPRRLGVWLGGAAWRFVSCSRGCRNHTAAPQATDSRRFHEQARGGCHADEQRETMPCPRLCTCQAMPCSRPRVAGRVIMIIATTVPRTYFRDVCPALGGGNSGQTLA